MTVRVNPRIGTALVLMPLVLGIALYGTHGLFAGLCAVVVLAGIWEWVGLVEPRATRRKVLAQCLAALLLAVCYYKMDSVMTLYVVGLSLLWWAAALVLVLRRRRGGKFNPGFPLQMGVGMIVLVPAWVSLVALHAHPEFRGPVLVACLLIMIWSADTGAYYTGKRWGRHKLAVYISPGKTVEGLFGAFGFGLAAALCCAVLLLHLNLMEGVLYLLVCTGAIAASIIGDLTESMVKRGGGVKDSGDILPGHGGALDRIDSLTAAAPVFFAGVTVLENAL